tara:strand:- start:3119 stop:3625 length:507 start_codon:yes stop_codon:yes gene_type:complete
MKDIQDYLINFIEKEQEIFSGFPVCPFAKKERIENKIKYVECSFIDIDTEKVICETLDWLEGDYSTLLYVDNSDSSYIQTNHFNKCIGALMDKKNVITFLFHKESKREFDGIFTRRSPRPFIMVGYKKQIGKKKTRLLKTKYYDKLTDKEYGVLNSKERKHGKNKADN